MVQDVFGIVGETLAGSFLIEEVIAEGGFGVVYRAEHVAFRAPVALKCLKIPGTITAAQSDLFIENFREEAEILFHLSASIPEVVRPLHADALTLPDGTFVPYIAMEWVEGQPLDTIVILREERGQKPLTLKRLIRMLAPIAHALSRAHRFQVPGGGEVSVTHCDLKPENIVITEPESHVTAKILDFGIAKARDTVVQNVGRITESEQASPFTPSYGAPEQWVPRRYGVSGPWTDVWGLALTLVECVTGRPPIDGEMHAMMGTALDTKRRPTPNNEGASVPDAVEAVFETALAVDPRDRYKDIESFWTDLEQAAGLPSSFERLRRRRDRDDSDAPPSDPLSDDEPDDEEYAFGDLDLDDDLAEPIAADSADLGGGGDDDAEFFMPGSDSDRPSRSPAPESMGSDDLDLVDSSRNYDPELGGAPPRRAAVSDATGPHRPARGAGITPAKGAQRGVGMVQPGGARPSTHAAAHDLKRQLRAPVVLVAIGILITAVDLAIARSTGESLLLGPVRVRWMAGALALVGIVLAFRALVQNTES